MTYITFDKLAYMETLKSGGVPETQARVHTTALDTALHDTVATRGDISDLRAEMRESELRMTIRLGGMIMALGGILIAIKFLG